MNEPGAIFLIVLVKYLFMMLIVGWIPALIAKSKGRNFIPWWFYGGGFFLIALIHALCIKNQNEQTEEIEESASVNPVKKQPANIWTCSCGEVNIGIQSECRICSYPKHIAVERG